MARKIRDSKTIDLWPEEIEKHKDRPIPISYNPKGRPVWSKNKSKLVSIYAVEDRAPRVYPWVNEQSKSFAGV